MRVLEIWRYPVKSLQGERLDRSYLGPEGVEGDRSYAIFDVETGFGLTGRREPALLFASAKLINGGVEITLPDGSVAQDDDDLSRWLGRPVTLKSNDEVTTRRYQNLEDFEDEDGQWEAFDGARGSFRDSQTSVVSLVSTGTLGEWEPRRFRANILLDGSGENDLVGDFVTLGGATLAVQKRLGRCVMVTRAQPGGIEKDLTVLRTVHREHDHTIAVGATVEQVGMVAVGDELLLNRRKG
jgi:uncharacterized protein YcbX